MEERRIEVGRDLQISGSTINLGEISGAVSNMVGQIPKSEYTDKPDVKDLLKQLQQIIEDDAILNEDQKVRALNQVKDIAEAAQNPNSEEMKYQAEDAISIIDKIAKRLPAAVNFVNACKNLLTQISSFFV